ncbi:MAG: fumarylacetoacetate hydrolase family protein [Neomegalonema sp.]|nr:fumarylacetoacetate hydrolase family protein [Neomegalonema sp.]
MKLLRYGPPGLEKPAMLCSQGKLRDISHVLTDLGGETVSLRSLDTLRALDPDKLPEVPGEPRIGAPLIDAPNFYCIGQNYAAHAAETGALPPSEPVVFSKATSSIAGPFDPIMLPMNSTHSDWEVELGVVIGARCLHVSEERALDYVSAYCVINDLSERHWQKERGGQWIKGKSAPGFGRIGPLLVSADEVPDPQALRLWLELNGERVQDSTTADMIFGVAHIIAYMSALFELRPGDIIATGTPSGVGMGFNPPRYLKSGDRLKLSVEGLGMQQNEVIAFVNV